MARWTGEWLQTLSSGGATTQEPPRWPGERLGLPQRGPRAVAGTGRRFLALLGDLVLASLLTAIFTRPDYSDLAAMQEHNLWALVTWTVITVVPVTFFGFTPGMALTGIRVARLDGAAVVGLWRAALRCVLTFFIVPAAVRNADNRGWHDRLTNTVVVTMR
ncbi:RDD family protein [Saccharomonospora xinjiangensis]|uniref:RDD family protein n=1 Tax=Saccharomonospora xinjiangensis TaxID=75294 RepID=UPI000592DFD9|nr:RDD family protein [Saccharomonospora xinjiangensis]